VGEDAGIHVFEIAIADVKGLGPHEFFGYARPEHQRTRNLVALHQFFHGQCRYDIQRLPRIVALAVAGCPFYDGVFIGYARLLAGFRDAVYVGADGDNGLAATPGGYPGGGHAGDVFLDGEALFFEQRGQVRVALHFLETQLREAKQHIVDLLRLCGAGLYGGYGLGLELIEGRGGGLFFGFLGRQVRWQQQREQEQVRVFHRRKDKFCLIGNTGLCPVQVDASHRKPPAEKLAF
jgi:hypothetical protein